MPKKKLAPPSRMQKLRERRVALGLVRVDVWVPAASVQALKDYAKGLTAGYDFTRSPDPDTPDMFQ